MKYDLLVTRPAKADVRFAARWYERQRRGLGEDFVAAVDAALKRVSENPLQYQALYRDARRAILRRFPYGVFFGVENGKIIVFCVIDLRRDPALWKGRIPS